MIQRLSNIDFIGNRRRWFLISGVLLIAGLTAILFGRLDFGIDFQGGAQFTAANASEQISDEEIRASLPPNLRQDALIQSLGENGYEVRTPVLEQAESTEVRNSLSELLGAEVSVNNISPSFGTQLRNDALSAIAASLLIIVVFITIRFEFGFALAGMVSLVHDILMTVGLYALVGREVNLVTVVAVLTILGYSLYDTIIIFDRIRENTPEAGYNKRRFEQVVNTSIRQVIRRSIYTTISTLIPVIALLIFGETVLSDFAFALLVGIASGAYSSIFIASPILCMYKAWQAKRIARQEREARLN